MHQDEHEIAAENEDSKELSGGLIKYYGLYWSRRRVSWEHEQMLAIPRGKTGSGNRPKQSLDNWNCINFWGQLGVYILYDSDIYPVYAGQAGVERKNKTKGNTIGGRLKDHVIGKYRNAWEYFSWFGFLEREKVKTTTRNLDITRQIWPVWALPTHKDITINTLLSSFEAIVIEGFIPRFNARGGDLKNAVYCNQYEGENLYLRDG